MVGLIIFDFDGVIAESEVLANTVLAQIVTELGVPTTVEDSYRAYMGKRFNEIIEEIQRVVGQELPEDFPEHYQQRTLQRFREELRPVEGAREFISAFSSIPQCIASSSSPDRLAVCLEILGLQAQFSTGVFSASMVSRGKPHPDIFLHAAREMGVAPSRCVVIEDSPTGVQAAVAAEMTPIGLLAAGHIGKDHRQRLVALVLGT